MSEKIKDYLGVAGIVALVGLTLAAAGYVRSYSKSIEPSSFRSFSVSGEGKVVAVPDVAEFTFSVVTQGGKDLVKLQTENTGKVNKAIAFVKSKGVDAKDIQTQGYSVEPRYQYYNCNPGIISSEPTPCPPAEIVGYTVTQSVAVKVRDFGRAGDIVSGVVGEGANSVSGLSFKIDDMEKVRSEARAKAIEQARTKAEAIAKAGGFSVGRLLSLNETGGGIQPIYGRGGGGDMMYEKALSAPVPSIEPGSQDTIVTVQLQYEID